jgi:hypothetical protein
MIDNLNYYVLAFVIFIAIVCYFGKKVYVNHMRRVQPTDTRKTEAFDGHLCYSQYETIVDNFLFANKIPHKRETKAEYGEFFTHSNGVPNFIIFTNFDALKIDSMIEILGIESPKNINPVVHNADVQPKYRLLQISLDELRNDTWKTTAYKFFKGLRKQIKKWAKKKVREQDAQEEDIDQNPKDTDHEN